MTARIVTHRVRTPFYPVPEVLEDMADRTRATIRRQHAEALPKVQGQLWTRLAEVSK